MNLRELIKKTFPNAKSISVNNRNGWGENHEGKPLKFNSITYTYDLDDFINKLENNR